MTEVFTSFSGYFVNRSKEKLLIIEKNKIDGGSLSSVLQCADYSVTRIYSFSNVEAELKKHPGDFFNLFIIARPEVITENDASVL